MDSDALERMGRGFAYMIFANCSPSKLSLLFPMVSLQSSDLVFNESLILMSFLVVILTYSFFGSSGKSKADIVLDSFFANLPHYFQQTGKYTKKQLGQLSNYIKASHEQYHALLTIKGTKTRTNDIIQLYAERCHKANNEEFRKSAISLHDATEEIIIKIYKTYYVA